MATSQTARVEPGLRPTLETSHDQGREIHIPELPSFQIRKFVSSIRSIDFSKCWPFRQKILEKSLTLGVKPLLPPFDLPPKCHQEFWPLDDAKNVQHCAQNQADYEHLETSSLEDDDDDEHLKRTCPEEEETKEQANGDQENQEEAQSIQTQIDAIQSDCTNNIGGLDYTLPGNTLGFENSCDITNDNVGICDSGIVNVKMDLLAYKRAEVKDSKSDSTTIMSQPEAALDESTGCDVSVHENDAHAKLLNNEESDNVAKSKDLVLREASQDISESLPEKVNESKHLDSLSSEQEFNAPQNKADKMRNYEEFSFSGLNLDVLMPQVCPVCLNFTSTSNTALNAHIDHCLESVLPSGNGEGRACKSRIKPRKMRSMVEICAVAAPRTLEDLELCSERWALNDTNPTDQSSNDMQSDDHPCDTSAFMRKRGVARKTPGKLISSHHEPSWKENATSEVDQPSIEQRQEETRNIRVCKSSECAIQGNTSNRNAVNPESEEQQCTGQHFVEEQCTISPSPKSSSKHTGKRQMLNKHGPFQHLRRNLDDNHAPVVDEDDFDNCHLNDEEDDLVLLERLETTILDTSADEEKRLQQNCQSENSDSDMSAQESLVSKVENMCAKHSENTGGSPSWIVTNGKYQMKVPSSDSKRLDEALKNRKRPQIDFDWVEEDVNVGAIAEDAHLDQRAGKSWKNKRPTPKTRSLVAVASHEKDNDGFPRICCGMRTQMNALEGVSLGQDAYLLQDGQANDTKFNCLKRKSPAILKEKSKGENRVKNARCLQNFDLFNPLDHDKTPESLSLTLNTIEHENTAESHSVCSVDENTFVTSYDNGIAVEGHVSSQNKALVGVTEKIPKEVENTLHTNRVKQSHVVDTSPHGLERFRAGQNVASDCMFVHESLKKLCSNQLSEETCSTSVGKSFVKEISNAAALQSHEERSAKTDPHAASTTKLVVQTCKSTSERASFYRNQQNNHQIISTSERSSLTGDTSFSQTGGIRMTYGYLPDAVKQNVPLTQTNHHQIAIEPCRLNTNGPSQRLEPPEMSMSGARPPLEQHFLRNNSHANLLIHEGQDVRIDPLKKTDVNRNHHKIYRKDSEKKHLVGNRSTQKQSHIAQIEEIDKVLQASLQTAIQTDVAQHIRHDSTSCRGLTSNLDTISTSEPGLQTRMMSDILDNFARSKSITPQVPMHITSGCQTTAEPTQHMHIDLHVGHEYPNTFPSQGASSHKITSNGRAVHHPQYLRSVSHTTKERNPPFITDYVNSMAGTKDSSGELSTSPPHMSRNITSSRINSGLSEAGLNNYSAVEYSGEQGVVHIFGNPVFKLMGKNVMVTNSNIKSLPIGNSMDQNGEQRIYPSNITHDQSYPQERFSPCVQGWHGDSSRLRDCSFATDNLGTHPPAFQRVSSTDFTHMESCMYKDHVQSTSHIQGERRKILHSPPQTHLKQQPHLGVNNANKQDASEAFLSEDCLPNTGTSITSMSRRIGNSVAESSNTKLIHDDNCVRVHTQVQAFPLSSRCITLNPKSKMREGPPNIVNGYHQQSGTLADIVQSSERKNNRQVSEHIWGNTSRNC